MAKIDEWVVVEIKLFDDKAEDWRLTDCCEKFSGVITNPHLCPFCFYLCLFFLSFLAVWFSHLSFQLSG